MRKQIDDNTKPKLTYARTYPCGRKSYFNNPKLRKVKSESSKKRQFTNKIFNAVSDDNWFIKYYWLTIDLIP